MASTGPARPPRPNPRGVHFLTLSILLTGTYGAPAVLERRSPQSLPGWMLSPVRCSDGQGAGGAGAGGLTDPHPRVGLRQGRWGRTRNHSPAGLFLLFPRPSTPYRPGVHRGSLSLAPPVCVIRQRHCKDAEFLPDPPGPRRRPPESCVPCPVPPPPSRVALAASILFLFLFSF